MRIKTNLAERPPAFTVAHEGTEAVIVFYTDVQEEQRDEGVSFSAISWTMNRPWTDGIEGRIEAKLDVWLALAQQEAYDQAAEEVRATRNALLYDSDCLMAADYPISDEARERAKAYRQALRDISDQPGFPYEVIWPTFPEL